MPGAIEAARRGEEVYKTAAVLHRVVEVRREEDTKMEPILRQKAVSAILANQKGFDLEKEADVVAARQGKDMNFDAAPAWQRSTAARESVEVPAEAFADVERQLSALVEGGEDGQISTRSAADHDNSAHCSWCVLVCF
jgi:hypothetical protein